MANSTPPKENEVTVTSLREFVDEIEKEKTRLGKFAEVVYRGQCGNWEVESGAYRRLHSDASEQPVEDLVQYQENLIHQAKQYDIEIKNDMSDIFVLSELQHYGAATSLIDFTKSALIALWFACQHSKRNNENEMSGKVFCLDISVPKRFLQLKGEEQESKSISEVLQLNFQGQDKVSGADSKATAIWKPAMANNRIIKQDSLFIFNKTGKLDPTMFQKIIVIPHEHKEAIRESLKNMAGFSEESLFPDFYGFAQNNSYDTPYGPKTLDEYMAHGIAIYLQGKFLEAIKYFDVAIKIDPQNSFTYAIRGETKRMLKQYKDAIADFDVAIRLNPQDSTAYASRGAAKRLLGQYQEAIADFDVAIRLNPQNDSAYAGRGEAKRLLRQHKEAITDFDKAIRLNPQNSAAYVGRGAAKVALRQHQDAITDFDEAIRLNPQNDYAYVVRGEAKKLLGQYREAIADFNAAIRLNPQNDFARSCKEQAEKDLGQES